MRPPLHTFVLCAAAALQGACAESEPAPQTPPSVTYTQNVAVIEPRNPGAYAEVPSEPRQIAHVSEAHRVLVFQSTHLDRPAEVVGVVDAHEEMGSHDDALVELQRKAALLGADAVVGVEFHHGDEEKGPTHLSGLAVRFVER